MFAMIDQEIAGGVHGRLVDIDDNGVLRDRDNNVVCWDSSGKIIWVSSFSEARGKLSFDRITRLPSDSFLVPGAIDCHLHFPQTKIIGGFGVDLLDWLDRNVWPEEKKFSSEAYATDVAKLFFRQLVSSGTTACMAFGSQFQLAMDQLFSHASKLGMLFSSGLVGQDRGTLSEVETTPREFSDASHSLIKSWNNSGRIRYAVMPRFSVACSPEMLEACGDVFHQHPSVFMQTHINESPGEIKTVMDLFPEHKNYLDTYEGFHLLNERASFAHSIHTTEYELHRLRETNAKVVHCPSSNGFLGSGAFPYQLHREHEIEIGVGTDVGAGTSFSMWKEMGHAHLMQMRLAPEQRFLWTGSSILNAMTRDGAKFFGMEDSVGSIDTGKWADFALVQSPEDHYLSLQKSSNNSLDIEHYLFRMATSHEENLIARTWIQGKTVFHRGQKSPFHPSISE